jgi:catalase (peroxidase I)
VPSVSRSDDHGPRALRSKTFNVCGRTARSSRAQPLNVNFEQSQHGVFTDRPGTLTNDFFVNLLDPRTEWTASASAENVYEGRVRVTGEVKWTGTAVDLVFGSHSQFRAIAEV